MTYWQHKSCFAHLPYWLDGIEAVTSIQTFTLICNLDKKFVTGFCTIRASMHWFGQRDMAICPRCGATNEITHQHILQCPKPKFQSLWNAGILNYRANSWQPAHNMTSLKTSAKSCAAGSKNNYHCHSSQRWDKTRSISSGTTFPLTLFAFCSWRLMQSSCYQYHKDSRRSMATWSTNLIW